MDAGASSGITAILHELDAGETVRYGWSRRAHRTLGRRSAYKEWLSAY
jgi:hypothetical protein